MAFPKEDKQPEVETKEPHPNVAKRFKQERSLEEINKELRANRPVAKAPPYPPRAGFEPEKKSKNKK